MNTKETTQRYFFTVIFIVIAILLLYVLKPFLTPLVLAGVFAIVFRPVYRRIIKDLRGHSFIASLITVLLILIVVLLPIYYIGQQVVTEALEVGHSLVNSSNEISIVDRVYNFLETKFNITLPEFDSTEIDQYALSALAWFAGNFGNIFTTVAGLILNLFIGILALFYLFKDGTDFKAKIIQLSPLKDKDDIQIINTIQLSVNSVIRGSLFIAITQAILTGIGMWVFGVPNPTLWGAVALIVALIPGIGTSLVLLPSVIYLFGIGSIGMGIGLAIWAVIAVGLIDNFMGPKLIGKRIKVHSFLILLVVLGGIAFLGPVGFIIGPLILSLFFALIHIYQENSI